MTGPLKLVVRLSKPKQSTAGSQQEPTSSGYSGGKPVKQRKREDSKHSASNQRVSGPYHDRSPPFPPAKKHKSNSDSAVRHESGVNTYPSKPPKLQLKLAAPQGGSSHATAGTRPVLEKPSTSSDGALSLRLSIPKSLSSAGNSSGGSAAKAGFDGQAKKRRSDVQSPPRPPHDSTGGAKKLKLPAGNSSLVTPSKQSVKTKPPRSKGAVSKKAWEVSSQSLVVDTLALEEASQQDVQSPPRLGVRGDVSTASKSAIFTDAAPVDAPTRSEMEKLVDKIQKKDASDIFRDPVTEDIAPGYFTVITKPMDFTTIRQKISSGDYASWDSLEEDITLMFNNAMTYNTQDTPYYKQARTLLDVSRKLLELARQGVTNFRGRTAGIVRAHNAKIAAEERAEKEAQLAALKAEKLAARKVVDKSTPAGAKTVGLNSMSADRPAAKPEAEAPKPRNNARPIVRENDGRRPLHNDENMRVTYKPLAEVPAAKWGLLAHGASPEGVVFSSDSHHVKLQQHQISKDSYLTSMARFVLSCSKTVQEYVLNKVVDCVPVESHQPKPVLNQHVSRGPGIDSSFNAQTRQASLHGNSSQPQFSGLSAGTFNLDKPGESTAHRLGGGLQPTHAASNNLHTLHGRPQVVGAHNLQSMLPAGGPGMLYAAGVQQAQNVASRNLANYQAANKGTVSAAPTVLSSQTLYQPGAGPQSGAGFAGLYNVGTLPYFGNGQVVQNITKSHDVLRQG